MFKQIFVSCENKAFIFAVHKEPLLTFTNKPQDGGKGSTTSYGRFVYTRQTANPSTFIRTISN